MKKFLLPGEVHFGRSDCKVSTLLGSCVAVCLYDPKFKIGAINHAIMPRSYESSQKEFNYKFVDLSLIAIIDRMKREAGSLKNVTAKVIGGAYNVASVHINEDRFEVGKRNAMVTKEILFDYGIKIVAERTGGTFGRHILFDMATGEVRVRPIKEHSTKILKALTHG